VPDDQLEKITMGGEKRRNVFLVFKEALHNSVKYSQADEINIDITSGDQLMITIHEVNGIGFDPEAKAETGNGLYNSNKRMNTIGGNIEYLKYASAMTIIISVPIDPPSNA
jgi:signal transduction histidine kinase